MNHSDIFAPQRINHSVRYLCSTKNKSLSQISLLRNKWITQSDIFAPQRINHSVRYLCSTTNESLSPISLLHNEWITQSDILVPQRYLYVYTHCQRKLTAHIKQFIIVSWLYMHCSFSNSVAFKPHFGFPDNYSIRSCVGSTIGYRLPAPQVAVQFIATHIQFLCKLYFKVEYRSDKDVKLRFAVWQPHVSTSGVQTACREILLFCEALGGVT